MKDDNRIFNLSIDPNIEDIAEEILSNEEVREAEGIAEFVLLEKHREHAIKTLKNVVGTKPKRPVYYLNERIDYLPEHTRDVIRYAGDYIDQLVKHCAHEKGNWRFMAYRRSLGSNLKYLKKILDESIFDILCKYNIVYVQAKHEWNVGSRPHLFSSKDAIFMCFITKKLSEQIISISSEAKLYSENKFYNYYNNRIK